MSRLRITAAHAQSREIPRKIERMIGAYVDIVLPGQSERAKLAARVGVRVIVQRAISRTLREVTT